MALVRYHALVLKSYETGNSSEIVHTVSADYGASSLYVRGLRKSKTSLRGLLQPLNLVEIEASLPEPGALATLREASLVHDHSSIVGDLERCSLGLLLAEAAEASCDEHHPSPEVFSALLEALHALRPEAGFPAPRAAAAGFLAILTAAGYEPQFAPQLLAPWPASRPRPHCFWLDAREGLLHAIGNQPGQPPDWPIFPPPKARHTPLPPEAVRFLYDRLRGGGDSPLTEPHAVQLLEALVRHCAHHQEARLRAWEFYRELRGG